MTERRRRGNSRSTSAPASCLRAFCDRTKFTQVPANAITKGGLNSGSAKCFSSVFSFLFISPGVMWVAQRRGSLCQQDWGLGKRLSNQQSHFHFIRNGHVLQCYCTTGIFIWISQCLSDSSLFGFFLYKS